MRQIYNVCYSNVNKNVANWPNRYYNIIDYLLNNLMS